MPSVHSYVTQKEYDILEEASKILHTKGILKQPTIYHITQYILVSYSKQLIKTVAEGETNGNK